MGKYLNKYRSESIRLQSWDYGTNASYFVTICTKDRVNYFGSIDETKKISLSEIGKHACKCWSEIPTHFPFVKLDVFIIMPDHLHGIIIIDKSKNNGDMVVGTQNFASLQQQPKNKFGPQSKNLGSIIRGFKIGITKFATMNRLEFGWQPRYYDHIIRNNAEMERVRIYIIENPAKWKGR